MSEQNLPLQASLQHLISQINRERTQPFWQDITNEVDPNYGKIVKNPMQLCHIEAKVARGEYMTVDQFIADLQLMADNTKLYFKDTNPDLVPLAEQIVVLCRSALSPEDIQGKEKMEYGEGTPHQDKKQSDTPMSEDHHEEPVDEATQALRADLHRKRHHIVEHSRRMKMRHLIERASELMPPEFNPPPASSEPTPLRAHNPNPVTVLNNTLIYVQHLQHRLRVLGAHELVIACTDEQTPLPPPPGQAQQEQPTGENGEKKPDAQSDGLLSSQSTQDILKTLTQAAVNVQRRGFVPKNTKANQDLLKNLTESLKTPYDAHSHFQIQTPHSEAMSKSS